MSHSGSCDIKITTPSLPLYKEQIRTSKYNVVSIIKPPLLKRYFFEKQLKFLAWDAVARFCMLIASKVSSKQLNFLDAFR